jgi:hypothetical protein
MANRLAGGTLPERLAELRATGQSWEDISRDLFTGYGIEVSSETLRKWGDLLGIPAKPETEAVA